MERPPEGRLRLVALGAPVLLAGILGGAALGSRSFEYAAVDLASLALLYLLLAICLHAGCVLCVRVARPLGVIASLAVGAILAWHFRELRVFYARPALFVAVAAGAGLAYLPLALRARHAATTGALAAACAASAALFALVAGVGYASSNTLRFHLLRQNKLIGTPAYLLLSEPVASLRSEVWQQRTAPSIPAPLPDLAGDGAVPAAERPHIVFLLVDTLRADSLGPWAPEASLTPRIDAFAARSTVFLDVITNATWTRPSMASLFTGLLPEEHGALDRGDALPADQLVLAEVLRGSGYTTVAFVSNFGAVGRDAGFAQGFDEFQQLEGGRFPYARADAVNESVAAWLKRWRREELEPRGPLFLYVHYLDPHTPYLSGGGREGPGPRRVPYEAEVRFLDHHLGQLLTHLEEALPGPRVVFLSSDHGEEFGEHAEAGHGHALYREVAQIPAILQTGGPPRALRSRLELRDFFDLLVRLSRRPDLDLAAWAEGRARSERYASVYLTTPASPHRPNRGHVCIQAIESDDFLYVWSAYGPTVELYDRTGDPGQTRNIARQHPEKVEELHEALEAATGPWAAPVPIQQNTDTIDLLRRLGYVE